MSPRPGLWARARAPVRVGSIIMTGFWDSGENMTAAERRQQRMAEARRRVETGENAPPPPPPAKPTRARTVRTPKAAAVDPRAVTGAQFAVWRSVQHFCTTDSTPDARSDDLDLLVLAAGRRGTLAHHPSLDDIPARLGRHFPGVSRILAYP